jgi:hypothetical protein
MSEGPGAGQILVGIFLILCGLCLTLLGGGCTAMWVFVVANEGDTAGAGGYLMMSLVTLGAGILLLWVSIKLLRAKPGAAPPASPRDPKAP